MPVFAFDLFTQKALMVFQRRKRFDENIQPMLSLSDGPMLRYKPGNTLPLGRNDVSCSDNMMSSDHQLVSRSLFCLERSRHCSHGLLSIPQVPQTFKGVSSYLYAFSSPAQVRSVTLQN